MVVIVHVDLSQFRLEDFTVVVLRQVRNEYIALWTLEACFCAPADFEASSSSIRVPAKRS